MEMLIEFISKFVAENHDDFRKWKAEKEKRNEIEKVG